MEEALIRVNAKEDRDAMMAKFFNRLNWDIDWYNYFEEKKVKLAVIEFTNYAIIWGGGSIVDKEEKESWMTCRKMVWIESSHEETICTYSLLYRQTFVKNNKALIRFKKCGGLP